MNTKHTPGPWKFESEKVGPVSREDDQSYGMVLPVAYIERFDFDNYIANANLISAAPELLESLESAVESDGGISYDGEDDEVGGRSCCGEVSYRPHRADCWVPKARAAIAKAKGDAS